MNSFLNFILFQVLWILTVFGAANSFIWPSFIVLLLMFLQIKNNKSVPSKEIKLILISIIVGFIIDSVLSLSGAVEYKFNSEYIRIAPVWIIILWAGLAMTLNHSMKWVFSNIFPGLIVIAVGAPLSYLAAYRLKAVELDSYIYSLLMISSLWILAYLVLFHANNAIQQRGIYGNT